MSALTSTAPADGSSLARRNPTVKLALLLVVSVVAVFVVDPITPSVLYVLGLAAVALTTRVRARTLVLAQVPFVVFAVGVFIVNVLSREGDVILEVGPLNVTAEGLSVGGALAVRTLLIGVLAIGFLLSTDGVALMTSLHQNARLSARFTFAILAGYRMLQEMPQEWTTIRQAHAVRVGTSEAGALPRGPRHLARVIFTLLVVSVRKGERIAQALESRGLGLTPRTIWRSMRVTRADWAMVICVLGVVAVVLFVSAWLGALEGPGALFG